MVAFYSTFPLQIFSQICFRSKDFLQTARLLFAAMSVSGLRGTYITLCQVSSDLFQQKYCMEYLTDDGNLDVTPRCKAVIKSQSLIRGANTCDTLIQDFQDVGFCKKVHFYGKGDEIIEKI